MCRASFSKMDPEQRFSTSLRNAKSNDANVTSLHLNVHYGRKKLVVLKSGAAFMEHRLDGVRFTAKESMMTLGKSNVVSVDIALYKNDTGGTLTYITRPDATSKYTLEFTSVDVEEFTGTETTVNHAMRELHLSPDEYEVMGTSIIRLHRNMLVDEEEEDEDVGIAQQMAEMVLEPPVGVVVETTEGVGNKAVASLNLMDILKVSTR